MSEERRDPTAERRRPGSNPARLGVKKTWKMYIGGAFVRSESGRYLVTQDGSENFCRASRKDVRDAVKAAVGAQPGWRKRTAMNRGQILYRLAEVLEARRTELEASLARAAAGQNGNTPGGSDVAQEVDTAIDRVVCYAGWADKFQSLLSSSNPVAGPHFGFSVPEPVGVVGILAPERPSLLGLVGAVCPVIVSGNTCVVAASDRDPRTAVAVAECLATSDFPGGVINILTGTRNELAESLVRHKGVRAVDLWNVDGEQAKQLEVFAADNVKRVQRRVYEELDWYDARTEGPGFIESFVEIKTVWHPMGA